MPPKKLLLCSGFCLWITAAFPPRPSTVRSIANLLLEKRGDSNSEPTGPNLVTRFVHRHPEIRVRLLHVTQTLLRGSLFIILFSVRLSAGIIATDMDGASSSDYKALYLKEAAERQRLEERTQRTTFAKFIRACHRLLCRPLKVKTPSRSTKGKVPAPTGKYCPILRTGQIVQTSNKKSTTLFAVIYSKPKKTHDEPVHPLLR
ncbi:hypothetical protein VTO42DRAFT_8677 [Malbranchea cinnamomea]